MKHYNYIFLVLILIFLSKLTIAQGNPEKSGTFQTTQDVMNKIFENHNEAIRVTDVMQYDYNSVVISDGESLADSLDLGNNRPIAFEIPSTWTTADITFQSWSYSEKKWVNMIDYQGNEIEYVPLTSTSCRINVYPIHFIGVRYLKIRSGTSASPVNQSGDKRIGIISTRY